MFSRSRAAGTGKEANFSFIGPEVTVIGDIETPGQLHLDGKVVGDVRCGGFVQGESGEVRGNIVAREAQLAGLVDGAVEAGTLALAPSARVTGDMLYESLSIARGAEVEGRFKRRTGAEDGSGAAKAAAGVKPLGRNADKPAAPELFPGDPPTAEAAE